MLKQKEQSASSAICQRLTVTGVVQGVGFRPFVYGAAKELGLTGFVGNDSGGVFIEIEGQETAVANFREILQQNPPPLAYIDHIVTETKLLIGATDFVIVHSQAQAATNTLISPDICLCADCLHELLNPRDRRYGYPFINCTNCGPRFTIIKDIPYDRPLTTMADFPMCADCQAEYDNPLDRRFHAQPNACPVCGPQVWLEILGDNSAHDVANSIQRTQTLLADGQIVAVKGLGGFHLACDATNDTAVATLRQRKGRDDKPFAVMAQDMATIKQFAVITTDEEKLITSKERPIVLLQRKNEAFLSTQIAPGNNSIGVMLPYTPLHTLLFHPANPDQQPISVLVMTSANFCNKPIIKDNDVAREHLAGLADAFLLHNRDIQNRCDDSVLRIYNSSPHVIPRSTGHAVRNDSCEDPFIMPVRRSRGYAPFPIKLPFPLPSTLAVGGELKATFCLAKDKHAYMSQHIGDMENLETMEAFATAVNHFQSIFRITPQLIACDKHPHYISTQWAEQQGVPVVHVQHHHAHIASLMAEHQLSGEQPVIGFSFDGTGYGDDGAIWGGEVLIADYKGFQRAAHLKYVPLAGGDAAVKRPYRLALSHLWAAGIAWDDFLPPVAACSLVERKILLRQLETGLNAVPTSSMGRLFDAVAALVGGRQTITYEGQAAIELEAIAADGVTDCYVFEISKVGEFDAAPIMQAIVADIRNGVETAVIAAKFHNAVAHLILQISLQIRAETELNQVALSGGVFQNVRLLETAVTTLKAHNFTVLTHRLIPPNDGGLALGQAIIAGVSSKQ